VERQGVASISAGPEKHKAQDLTSIGYFAEEVDDEKSVKTGDVVCAGRCWV